MMDDDLKRVFQGDNLIRTRTILFPKIKHIFIYVIVSVSQKGCNTTGVQSFYLPSCFILPRWHDVKSFGDDELKLQRSYHLNMVIKYKKLLEAIDNGEKISEERKSS